MTDITGMSAGEGGVMASVLGLQNAERNAHFALQGLTDDALQRVIVAETTRRFGWRAGAWLMARATEAEVTA